MAKLVVNSESLVSVADAIREKGGTTEDLEFPQGFVDAVGAIESGGGAEFTAGFTSEKYKKWLEINGYTILKFTLTTTALADFDISHTLGRKAQSIICFRADIDCTETDRKVYFAFDLYGEAKDIVTNRYDTYVVNPLRQVAWGMLSNSDTFVDYYAVKENTNTYIKFRFVDNFDKDCIWASGDYYLAVL